MLILPFTPKPQGEIDTSSNFIFMGGFQQVANASKRRFDPFQQGAWGDSYSEIFVEGSGRTILSREPVAMLRDG